ncbi:MAG: nucleotide exchange factor GrpE [Planctomycetes bacterium]|nr:nucleotide exchange factor GrpE [Planctomycetota bacterium]
MSNDPTKPTPTTRPGNGSTDGKPAKEAARNDGTNSEGDVESLRARAEAAERDRDQYLAMLKSKTAEFENYQKRQRRIQEDESRYAQYDFALGLLPILDNLERATAAAKQAGETGPLVQGVAMVETQFLDLLRRFGVTRIDALGKPFDPNLHQAVMQQPSAEHPPHTVVNVFAPGYTMHDRVLRPAQVAVSVPPS